MLHEAHEIQRHVFFPTTAIVSLLYVMENGVAAEIAVVGDDGIVGVPLFMGGQYSPSRAVVQSAGQAFQLKAQPLMDEFNRNGPVLHLLLRYTQALITQWRKPPFATVITRWATAVPLAAPESRSSRRKRMLGVRREWVLPKPKET